MRESWAILGPLLAIALAACQPAAPAPAQRAAAPASQTASSSQAAAAQPAAAARQAEPAALSTVRVAHAGIAPEVASIWLAADLGLDRQYGLQIELVQTRSAALSQAALLSGEIDYAWTGFGPTLTARTAGSTVVFLGATSTRAASELVTQPGYTTPDSLRGAAFGVHSFGGPPHLRTLGAVKRLGLDLDRDRITILVTGDEPTTAAALQERALTGATLSYASAQELKAQGHHSWDLGALGVPDVLGIVGLSALVHERGDDTLRLLRALATAQAYLRSGATDAAARERAATVIAQRMRAASVEPILLHIDRTREQVPVDLRVSLDDVRELQAGMGSLEASILQVPVEQALDLSFRDRLAQEGFFAQLAAR